MLALLDDETVTDADADADADGVPAHWLTAPGASSGPPLLYLHGGGYTLGSLRSHGPLAARLGRVTGRRGLFPEYRCGERDLRQRDRYDRTDDERRWRGHFLTLGVDRTWFLRVEPGASRRKRIATGRSSAEVLGDVPGSRV
jgi:hypothetical protein